MTVKCPYCGTEGKYKICHKCRAEIPDSVIEETAKAEREKKRKEKEGGKE